jgi:hypothetical protein
MTEPLLDLSTLAPKRETVKVTTPKHPDREYGEGEEPETQTRLYEIATPDDLSIADNQWLMDRAEAFYRLGVTPESELSDEQRLEADLLLNKCAKLALIDAPQEVIEALPRPAKWRLVAVFLIPFAEKLAPIAQTVKGTKVEQMMSTGVS